MSSKTPVLSCQQLKKSFSEVKKELPILKGIDFEVNENQCVAILGTSGSGKSTFLHLLGGLDLPTSGHVYWHDQDINELSEKRKCRLRNVHLGFIYQFHYLLPEFTALENVAMPLLIRGIKPKNASKMALEMLNKVGLSERIQHKIGELSGGERQRTAIARALVIKPKCVLADEPTGNLDQENAEHIIQIMMDLQKSMGTSFVIVTHDLKLARKMQKCYELKNGLLSVFK